MNKGFALIEMLVVVIILFVLLVLVSHLSVRSKGSEVMGELSPDATIVSKLISGEEVPYSDMFGLMHSGTDRPARLRKVALELHLDYAKDIYPAFAHNNLMIRYKLAPKEKTMVRTASNSAESEQ